MGVSYNDDLGTAKRIIEETLSKETRVMADPAPTVAVSELADSSVNFVVRPWVKSGDYWPTRFDLTRALKENLEAGGCSIPYPQQDLHVMEMPAQATH
jgi:small conductance mechanosensitive channel